MREPNSALLFKAWRRASRRRRRYALAAVLVLVAVAALAALLTHQPRRHERPVSERARAVLAVQRALAQEKLAMQARLRARTAGRAVLAMQRAAAQENLAMQARLRARAAAKQKSDR